MAEGMGGGYLVSLYEDAARSSADLAPGAEPGPSPDEDDADEDDADDDTIDDVAFMMASQQAAANRGNRTSVSAEAYGHWNKIEEDFQPPVYEKSPEHEEFFLQMLSRNPIFAALPQASLRLVVGAIFPHDSAPGEVVIQEGDDGDYLFIVEAGELECSKLALGVIKRYGPGDVFGELALLYNCPRAATIVALQPCRLWKLDRKTFNNIVREVAGAQVERIRSFIMSVPMFGTLDLYEQTKLAEAMREVVYNSGDVILQQGEFGDNMFWIEEGSAQAQRYEEDGQVTVMDHGPGDYFGELALLNDSARAANVIALSQVHCWSIDRKTFTNLMGSLKDLLEQSSATRYGG
jgi:cAMP-dependent protein kinase regulator